MDQMGFIHWPNRGKLNIVVPKQPTCVHQNILDQVVVLKGQTELTQHKATAERGEVDSVFASLMLGGINDGGIGVKLMDGVYLASHFRLTYENHTIITSFNK